MVSIVFVRRAILNLMKPYANVFIVLK